MARFAFLTCHLSGTGHLVRTLRLARAALARGHHVAVINGGRPLDHIDTDGVTVVQMPPLHVAKLDFSTLLSADNTPADQAYLVSRMEALKNALTSPVDVLITELFPFGRRSLADEFLAAIRIAQSSNQTATVIASVRDIPEPKPKRLPEAAQRLADHYDGVLVHGDEGLVPLWTTWPLPNELRAMVHHTGYVAPDVSPRPTHRGEEVLVATGGGILGEDLLPLVTEAAMLSSRPWRILVGGPDAAKRAAALATSHQRSGLTIEPTRADYLDLLARAACSISLAGYNTVIELAGLTTPALLVPSEEGGEQEQLLRASALTGQPGIEMLRSRNISPTLLRNRAEALAAGPSRETISLKADDGRGAIAAIENLLGTR